MQQLQRRPGSVLGNGWTGSYGVPLDVDADRQSVLGQSAAMRFFTLASIAVKDPALAKPLYWLPSWKQWFRESGNNLSTTRSEVSTANPAATISVVSKRLAPQHTAASNPCPSYMSHCDCPCLTHLHLTGKFCPVIRSQCCSDLTMHMTFWKRLGELRVGEITYRTNPFSKFSRNSGN